MKEKLKRFFIEKKELLLFVGVLLVVFSTVIFVANYALSGGDENPDDPSTNLPGDDDDPEDPVTPKPTYKITLPISGDYVVVRTFFDVESSREELAKAVINTGTMMIESQGISYAKQDNSAFDVHTILPGKVTHLVTDKLEGTVVTIEHENNVISIYHALSAVNVKLGDEVKENDVIGKAGTSLLDNEAGVHMHLEVMVKDEYVNPSKVFGKQASEVSSSK